MIGDEELQRIADQKDGREQTQDSLHRMLARELLAMRAQIARLTGNAPTASKISEEDRQWVRTERSPSISTVGFCAKILDALESAEHENARLKSVLLDRRLDDGAEQLREACARKVEAAALAMAVERDTTKEQHAAITRMARNAARNIREIPVSGAVTSREKEHKIKVTTSANYIINKCAVAAYAYVTKEALAGRGNVNTDGLRYAIESALDARTDGGEGRG